MVDCAAGSIEYVYQLLNITDTTTFITAATLTASSVVGINSHSTNTSTTVPTAGPKLLSLQVKAITAGAAQNVNLPGAVLLLN